MTCIKEITFTPDHGGQAVTLTEDDIPLLWVDDGDTSLSLEQFIEQQPRHGKWMCGLIVTHRGRPLADQDDAEWTLTAVDTRLHRRGLMAMACRGDEISSHFHVRMMEATPITRSSVSSPLVLTDSYSRMVLRAFVRSEHMLPFWRSTKDSVTALGATIWERPTADLSSCLDERLVDILKKATDGSDPPGSFYPASGARQAARLVVSAYVASVMGDGVFAGLMHGFVSRTLHVIHAKDRVEE